MNYTVPTFALRSEHGGEQRLAAAKLGFPWQDEWEGAGTAARHHAAVDEGSMRLMAAFWDSAAGWASIAAAR
jgi:hypothetical protein